MTGGKHVAIGVIASVGVSAVFLQQATPLPPVGIFIITSGIGSLLPDVDFPTAKINRLCPPIAYVLRRFFSSTGYYFGNSDYQNQLNAHRGICHSLSACFVTFLFWLALKLGLNAPFSLLGIVFGMLLHIICDAFTPIGVLLFAPFTLKQYWRHRKKKIPSCFSVVHSPIIFSILLYIINVILSLSGVLYFFVFILVLSYALGSYSYQSEPLLGNALLVMTAINIFLRILRIFIAKKVRYYCFDINKLKKKSYKKQQLTDSLPGIPEKSLPEEMVFEELLQDESLPEEPFTEELVSDSADIPLPDNIIPFDSLRKK